MPPPSQHNGSHRSDPTSPIGHLPQPRTPPEEKRVTKRRSSPLWPGPREVAKRTGPGLPCLPHPDARDPRTAPPAPECRACYAAITPAPDPLTASALVQIPQRCLPARLPSAFPSIRSSGGRPMRSNIDQPRNLSDDGTNNACIHHIPWSFLSSSHVQPISS
jgi:hypothetical protein